MPNKIPISLALLSVLCLASSGFLTSPCPANPLLSPGSFHGLCLGPYLNDPYQEPGQPGRPPLPTEQIEERVARIAPFADWIRTYATSDGQDYIPVYARSLGVRTLIGTWIVAYGGGEDRTEIERAFEVASSGNMNLGKDIVVIGNEEIFQSRKTPDAMRDYIRDVAKPIRNDLSKDSIPISIAEPWYTLFDELGAARYPSLMNEIDGPVLVNIFPFHEKVGINGALDYLMGTYNMIKEKNPGLDVWIGETGWPSAGDPVGGAVPSPENAAQYLQDCIDWTASEDVPLCYFDAYDEDWKAYDQWGNLRAPVIEAHWGVWYNDGTLKVPEPGVLVMLLGMAGLALLWRRRRKLQPAQIRPRPA